MNADQNVTETSQVARAIPAGSFLLMDMPLPNPTKRNSALVCDIDQGMHVASRHPTPEQGALIEEYRRSYTNAFGHSPKGMHVIACPGNPEGLAVLYPPLVLNVD